MKTLIGCVLLSGGAALAQNPAPILWVAPPVTHSPEDRAQLNMDNVAVGDLSGDGRPDVVYVDRNTGGVHLLTTEMSGHWWPRRGGDPLTTTSPDGFVALGDLNGDDRVDAAALSLQGDGRVRFGLRQADGSIRWEDVDFAAAAPLGSSHGPSVADVTGDGIADLVLNDPEHRAYTLAGAAWQPLDLSAFRGLPHPLQIVDFDGDGDPDAVGSNNNQPILFRNDGAFPWTPTGPVQRSLGEGRFAVADIIPGNGAEPIGSTTDHLHVMRKQSPVDWPAWTQTPHLGMYQPVAVDVDGDDDLDLVGAAVEASRVLVFLENDGTGTFRQQRVPVGAGAGGNHRGRVWPADLNGDGYQDFVVAYDQSILSVYATGAGVLGATFEPEGDATADSGARIEAGVVTVTALVPLPEPVTVTELTLLVDGAPAPDVLASVEVSGGGQVSGRLEGVALDGPLRVPLAGNGLRVSNNTDVRLRVTLRLSDVAHRATPELRVAWDSVRARFADGEPAPVVNQIQFARTVTLRNGAPVAQFDVIEVPEGRTTLLDVLANDSDPEGDPLTIEITSEPRYGVAEVVDGQIRYTHDGRDDGRTDRLFYRVRDPRGATSAEVPATLRVTPVNDPPMAEPDAYVTREDVPLVVEFDLGPLANDIDPDSAILTVVLEQPPAVGDLQLEPDGSFVYLPPADFDGEVTFTYRADDGEALSAPATVTITVLPDDDAPRPAAGPFATAIDTAVVLDLGGVDPEGGATVLLIERFPTRGYLTDLRPEAGRVTYVPRPGIQGEDRFTYRLRDDAVVSGVYEAVVTVGR